MAESSDLRHMVMAFRVSELQVLLGFAGKNKCGRKQELLVRALQLIQKGCSTPVQIKIRELYRQIQSEKNATTMRMQQSTTSHDDRRRMYQSSAFGNSSSSMSSSISGSSSDRDRKVSQPSSKTNSGSGYEYSSSKTTSSQYGPPSALQHNFPIHNDVRFKRLPFYDMLGELLKPATLAPRNTQRYQETTCVFHLTPQQAQDIAMSRDMRPGSKCDYHVQVQLRFCFMETSCDQGDNFPPSICVRVNGKIATLPNPIPTNKPGVEPKRPGRPVNITSLCRISPTQPNQLVISWSAEYGRNYCVAVYLVRKQTSDVLLSRLKAKGVKHPDHSRALIKEKLRQDADCEIATTSLRVSLLCPLGKMRMQVPCRASTCTHLQCFDAATFLMMNEKKPTWICPVCDKESLFDKLILDGLFKEIYEQTDCRDIEFMADGTWKPLTEKHETHLVGASTPASCRSQASSNKSSSTAAAPKGDFIDLTLSSDDDDDDDDCREPPAKRQNTGKSSSCSSDQGPAIIEVDTPPRTNSPPAPLHTHDSPVCLSSTGNSETSPQAAMQVLDFDDSDSSNTIITNRSASSSPDQNSPSTPTRSPLTSPLKSPAQHMPLSPRTLTSSLHSPPLTTPLVTSSMTLNRVAAPSTAHSHADSNPLRFITATTYRPIPMAPAYAAYPYADAYNQQSSVPPVMPVPNMSRLPSLSDPPMAHSRPVPTSNPIPVHHLQDSDFNFDDLYPFSGLPGLPDMGPPGLPDMGPPAPDF